jgi:hypothetical protein
VRKLIVAAIALVMSVVVLAVVADFTAGIVAEYRFSRSLRSAAELRSDPEITISGFPFAAAASRGEYSQIGITARNALVGDGRQIDMRSRLSSVRTPTWLIGENTMFHVDSVDSSIKIDSVNLGRFLHIVDLTVTTPADKNDAGGGGPQDGLLSKSTGILLTGSVQLDGKQQKVSVLADLAVVDGALTVRATAPYSGPEEHVSTHIDDADLPGVLAQFSATLPALAMPWGIAPTTAQTQGSDVVLQGTGGARELRLTDFRPHPE